MKRRALRLMVFVVAGAIINLAVAWGIAHWVQPFKGRGGAIGLNGRQALWSRLQKDHWPRDLVHEGSTVGRVGTQYTHLLSWGTEPRPLEVGGEDNDPWQIVHYQVGWPMFTLECWFCWQESEIKDKNALAPAISFAPELPLEQQFGSIFPYGIVVPAFAINTSFYAAILWMLFAFPFVIRRWLRIRRGQCASCGYSLRGAVGGDSNVCPECGAALRVRSIAA